MAPPREHATARIPSHRRLRVGALTPRLEHVCIIFFLLRYIYRYFVARGNCRRIGAGNRTCAGTYSQSSSIVRWCIVTAFATCVYLSRDKGQVTDWRRQRDISQHMSKQNRSLAGAPAPRLLLDVSSSSTIRAVIVGVFSPQIWKSFSWFS